MSLTSLPNYPDSLRPRPDPSARRPGPTLSPRVVRILWSVTALVLIVVTVGWLQLRVTKPEPPPPLDFRIVAEKYEEVRLYTSREQVEDLLGPPHNRVFPEPDIQKEMERADDSLRDAPILGWDRAWATWSDSEDEGRWVAILFVDGKVYWKAKKGF